MRNSETLVHVLNEVFFIGRHSRSSVISSLKPKTESAIHSEPCVEVQIFPMNCLLP